MAARILVIRGGAIGDFVLTLPALSLLRENFPTVQIEILGYRHILALAEGRHYAEQTRSIEYGPLSRFFTHDTELPNDLVEYFAAFEHIISYLYDPDGHFERNLRRCGVKSLLCGHALIQPDAHAAHQLAKPLEHFALYLESPAAHLHPTKADRLHAVTFLGADHPSILAVHAGSGGERKNWPIKRWISLLEKIHVLHPDRELLLVGGEADGARLRALVAHFSTARLAENLPLPELAAVLERCSLFLGHDSGISHIAAAVETPCVLLFGPTDPEVWAPRNAGVRVVAAIDGRMESIPVDSVLCALVDLVNRPRRAHS